MVMPNDSAAADLTARKSAGERGRFSLRLSDNCFATVCCSN